MSLKNFKEKRTLPKTDEPEGGKPSERKLHFVVQKHAASQLHYDFRLEMRGVLKSWAVPKGPSLNPSEKRLAMLVEDHPYDYRTFEGIIPKGNYGAGTVIIWDQGTYESIDDGNKEADQEELLARSFHAGKINITLCGRKLKGAFTLIRNSRRGENAWLLFKRTDRHATEKDIRADDKSVVSGKTIEEAAADDKANQ